MSMNVTAGPTPYDAVRTLSAEALLQELRSDVPLTILDVRDRAQIDATGTIAGARTFPLYQLAARRAELEPHRSTAIVIVSQRGHRARIAAFELGLDGFEEVFVLDGGILRWLELGYAVEPRRSRIPSAPRA